MTETDTLAFINMLRLSVGKEPTRTGQCFISGLSKSKLKIGRDLSGAFKVSVLKFSN